MKKETEEYSYGTPPVVTEECANNEIDYENINDLIEENKTKLNDKDGDDTEVNYKEGDETIDNEFSTSEELGDTHKGE